MSANLTRDTHSVSPYVVVICTCLLTGWRLDLVPLCDIVIRPRNLILPRVVVDQVRLETLPVTV